MVKLKDCQQRASHSFTLTWRWWHGFWFLHGVNSIYPLETTIQWWMFAFESLQLEGSYLETYCTLVSLPLRWYFLRQVLYRLPEFPSRIQPQLLHQLYHNFSSAFSPFLSLFFSLLPVPLGMTSQINSLHSKSWLTSTFRELCCLSQFRLLKQITIAGVT